MLVLCNTFRAKLARDTSGDALVPVYDGGASDDAVWNSLFDFGSMQRAVAGINFNDFLERDDADNQNDNP